MACSGSILSDLSGVLGVVNENSSTVAAGTVLSHANGFDVSSSPFAVVQNSLTWASGFTGTIDFTTANLTLSKKTLTVDTGFAVAGRTYDGLTDATITSKSAHSTGGGSTSGDGEYVTGDTVSIIAGGTATFGSKNAGSETATGSLTLTGAQAADYTLTVPTAIATIAKEPLTITARADTKTYDGTTTGTVTPTVTSGAIMTGDSASFSETYSSKNVGSGLTLTPSGIVNDGNAGNNYSYTFDTVDTGTINAAANSFSIADIPSTVLITSHNPLADNSDGFDDALDRITSNSTGTYSSVQAPTDSGRNYNISRDDDGVINISFAPTMMEMRRAPCIS